MEVAVSIAAQLLSDLDEDNVVGPSWREVQQALGKVELNG